MGQWPRDNQAEQAGTRHRNRPGFRFCNKCDHEFALNATHFPRDGNRAHGLGYQCRPCERTFRKPDRRVNRWSATMTDEQKANKRDWQRRYTKTDDGRVSHRVASYRQIDTSKGQTCDLDPLWFRTNIDSKPCHYCGDNDAPVGCDRIDNALGHTKANVVPCCFECNVARLDNFTHAEMRVIGQAIAFVKAHRKSTRVAA